MTDIKNIFELLSTTNTNDTFFIKVADKTLKFTIEEVDQSESTYSNKTTIVTGLWNMGREKLSDNFKRSYDEYKQKFIELLKSPVNMYIYVSKSDEELVWKHRSKKNTQVHIMELDAFDTWFEFFDQVQDIRKQPSWYNQVSWLADSPQAKLKYYNPIVFSKMFLLNNVTYYNPFQSEYFYWIDAGITNTVHPGYFSHDKVLNNLDAFTEAVNRFTFLTYPYEPITEIHGFQLGGMYKFCNTDVVNYVCRGGFFGGKKDQINKLNGQYHSVLQQSLESNYMGTEESIFTILSHRYPDEIYEYTLNYDGLVWPFFEDLKNIDSFVEKIKSVPKKLTVDSVKNNLYVLTFNSPAQFKTVCESIKAADTLLFTKSNKILINNSTDVNTFDEYDRLCLEYNFTEIHKDNIGVCGGRQFVAEHFDQSDADFYMFFEDDMLMNPPNMVESCKSGLSSYVPNLYETVIKIMLDGKLDFLKFSFSEFYGDNSVQWAWYNVPQEIRTLYWPEYDKLPVAGLDPHAPKTLFNAIQIVNGVSYITGEIYYSNWPQIVSRDGNRKMFLDTTWNNPYEQTWMSHMYQLTKTEELRPGVLLASPITHNRFEHYDDNLRKES